MTEVMEEVHLTTIKPKNNVLLLAQEISFAKVLACNDKRLRDRGIRRLKKWFMTRSQGAMDFTEDDHMRIWKGLFYCMWMADKPLVQEELAEEISQLIHSFASFNQSLLFVGTFFASLSIEWFGIDQLRLDKFMMLVRRFMRQSLALVAKTGWDEDKVQLLVEVYLKTLSSAPMGLSMHIIEVFCEELAKVGKGELSNTTVLQFVTMFVQLLSKLNDGRMISQITRCVFLHLIRQTELGIEHQMKFSAWKEFGFPGGDLDCAEKVEQDSSDEEQSEEEDDEEWEEERKVAIDARAGKVDVLLPPLDFNPTDLLAVLRDHRNKPETTTKARKTLIQLINKYENLAAGKYPLGVHKVNLPDKTDKKKEIDKAVKRLWTEEKGLDIKENEPDQNVSTNRAKKRKSASVWEVSKAEGSISSNNDSVCNTSWEVSDSMNKDNLSKSNKRKNNEKEDLNFIPCKNKKTKNSVTKKHSSPIPSNDEIKVSDTLKNSEKQNASSDESVTKKRSSTTPKNDEIKISAIVKNSEKQNTSSDEIKSMPAKKRNSGKQKRKTDKKDKSKIANVSSEELVGINNSNCKENTVLNITKEDDSKSEIQLQKENNNGWGGDWDAPLNSGGHEILPNKKYAKKRKSTGNFTPTSSISLRKENSKNTPKTVRNIVNTSTPSSSQKKVGFNLSANCSQEFKDYKRNVRLNKKQVLFDASKKPTQGLLKNSTPSPINPFYKRKLKLLASPGNV